jgi:predicted nucleic acid-binding protein
VADRAIINASPSIFLSRAGHLDLLRIFASEIWVPEPVAGEIRQRGPGDITARMLDTTHWLSGVPAPSVPRSIADWRLGGGESSVLALALEHPGTDAIIDDLAARRCAATLSIPLRGTASSPNRWRRSPLRQVSSNRRHCGSTWTCVRR